MDKYYIHYKVWDEITYSFPNFNGATIEICKGSAISSHFTGHVITHTGIKFISVKKVAPRNEDSIFGLW